METPDPLISCPYNQSHQILKSRMQYHLTKCRKNHPDAETEICPLDATHHVPKPELPFHVTVCPNRRLLDCAKYVTTDSAEKAALPPYQEPSLPPSTENWDLETVTSSYQPSQKAAEAPVLRQLIGATKSERKKFRLQERRRVQELQEKGYFDPQESSSSSSSKSSAPLRLPADFVPPPGNPDLGLGRGASHKSDDKSVDDSLAAFSSLSLSIGRGTRKEGNAPSKSSTPGNWAKESNTPSKSSTPGNWAKESNTPSKSSTPGNWAKESNTPSKSSTPGNWAKESNTPSKSSTPGNWAKESNTPSKSSTPRNLAKESNTPSKSSTPGDLAQAASSSTADANVGKGSCRLSGEKSLDDPVAKFSNLSMSMGRGTGAIPRHKV